MSVATPLLDTIEPDELTDVPSGNISNSNSKNARPAVVLTPTMRQDQMATTASDAEAGSSYSYFVLNFLYSYYYATGIAGLFRQV